MSIRQELFIFDLDGTLVDSSSLIELAAQQTLLKYGLEPLPTGYVKSRVGKPPRCFFSEFVEQKFVDELVADFRVLMGSEPFVHPDVYPGAESLLKELQERNILLAIATTKSTELAIQVLKSVELYKYFSMVQGSEDIPPKPDPSSLICCMEKLNTNIAIMVGDTEDDVLAAQNAGIDCIAVDHGSRPREVLESAAPKLIVDSLSQLQNRLEFLTI